VIDFDESAIIKKSWLKLWPHNRQLPQFEIIVASYDTALTEETYDKDSQKADPTACLVFGIFLFEGRINALVLNAWDKRLGMPDLIEHAKEEARIEYGHMEPVSPTTYVEAQAGKPPTMVRVPKKVSLSIIEDIGGGRAARQMLEKEKLPMFAYNPGRASKLERINVVAHIVKSGRLWLHESATPDKHGKPKHASWADPFVAQVCQYTGPGSTIHDDYVDSLSQFLRWFADNYLPGSAADKIRRPAPPPPPAPNPYGG
jgi:phage terminase large subunit-like protein